MAEATKATDDHAGQIETQLGILQRTEELDMTDAQSSNDAEAPASSWTVWRIDDNGNRFVVRERLSHAEAERLVADLTALGHKQVYWAECNPR